MKAITIMQPWATLVAIGIKRIETRSWRTHHRGPLAIHAAAAYPRANRALAETPAFRYALRNERGPLSRGMVLATCEVVYCTGTESLTDQLDLLQLGGPDALLAQFQFGDFTPGRFAWGLSEVRQLPTPIPATGSLGLWEWNGEPSYL